VEITNKMKEVDLKTYPIAVYRGIIPVKADSVKDPTITVSKIMKMITETEMAIIEVATITMLTSMVAAILKETIAEATKEGHI